MPARRMANDRETETEETILGFTALLQDLDSGDGPLPDPLTDAGTAFRYVYDGFVRRGDYERGKPRHAVRQIKNWLGENQVRSLETKLAGKTWLKYQDAHHLLKLFLSRWQYNKLENTYTPYREGDLDTLTSSFLEDLFPEGNDDAILLPDRSRSPKAEAKTDTVASPGPLMALEETKPSNDIIRRCFEASDALVTVSRVRTIIDTQPARAMTGFNEIMADLYEIDQKDERKRAAVWVIDLGLRNKKIAARGAIYNVQLLAAQFHAIALIEGARQRELYNWLQKNVCIIVGSLHRAEIDALYDGAKVVPSETKQDSPWFQSDRLFLESIPGRWLDARGSEAFGKSQGQLWQMPTITAHLRMENWSDDELEHTDEEDLRKNLRYFFHGSVDNLPEREEPVRCIPLPEPGSRWSDAYRLACSAAFLRLGYASEKRLSHIGTPEDALAHLRDQHFAVLTLDEFLDLPKFLSTLTDKH